MMFLPLTTAHTFGPGNTSFLHAPTNIQSAATANMRIFPFKRGSFRRGRISGGLHYFASADAGGAHADLLAHAFDYRSDAPQIRIPAATRHIVGVADRVTEAWSLAANFTGHCHYDAPEN